MNNNSPQDYLVTMAVAFGLIFCGLSAIGMDEIYPTTGGAGWFIGAGLICLANGVFGFLIGAALGKKIWSRLFKPSVE